jgi:hypothetical protein
MPTDKTLCCLRFERKGRACRDCPILETLRHSMRPTMRPAWLRHWDKRMIAQQRLGERATRYLVCLKRRLQAIVHRYFGPCRS